MPGAQIVGEILFWVGLCSWFLNDVNFEHQERLKAEGEGSVRGQDGWMASLLQWS